MKKKIIIPLLFLVMGAVHSAQAEMVVIVNKENPATSITRIDLSLIYLGMKKLYDTGDMIMPVDLNSGKPTRQEFFTKILRKDEESYRLYWIRMIFSGKGQPPLAFKTEEEAVRFVTANRGAIAFVDSKHIPGDVKTLRIVENE
jgi:hypothetical protein